MAVLEDEPFPRQTLMRLLKEAGCKVVGEFSDGQSLMDWLLEGNEPDALFLDIHTPKLNGIDIPAQIHERLNKSIPFVFVTAHIEYALQGHNVGAAHFLLKPLTTEILAVGLARLNDQLDLEHYKAKAIKEETTSENHPISLTVVEGNHRSELYLKKITHFEVQEQVVWACVGSRKYRCYGYSNLVQVINHFGPDARITRINRNLLVHDDAVIGFELLGNHQICLIVVDEVKLEVSRMKTPLIKKQFGFRFPPLEC